MCHEPIVAPSHARNWSELSAARRVQEGIIGRGTGAVCRDACKVSSPCIFTGVLVLWCLLRVYFFYGGEVGFGLKNAENE